MRSEKEESPKNKDIEKEKEELVAINRARKGLGKQFTKKLTNVVRLTGSGKKNSSIARSPDGEFASKWMDDDESTACMVCDSQFCLINRKHHCRRCGILVCAVCSSHKIKFANKTEEKRVCDNCFQEVSNMKDAGLVNAETGIAEEVVVPTGKNVPSWMFVMKPFAPAAEKVFIGQVFTKIYEGKDLPAMDFTGFSDPYVRIKIGDNEAKTTVMPQTLNPKWAAAEFVIPVAFATDKVELHVYDQDVSSSDDKMGIIELPLAELSHQKTVRKWFNLHLEPDVLKAVKAKHKDGDIPVARLLVEFQYTFSRSGEFFSYLTAKPTVPVPEAEFQITLLNATIWRLLQLLAPVFWLFGQIGEVFMWKDTFKSMTVLLIFCTCTLYPWLYPILLQSLLLYHMTWKYMETQLDASFSNASSLPANLREMEKELKQRMDEAATSSADDGKKKQEAFDGLFTGLASKSIAATGLTSTLKWLQNLLVFICDIIEMIWNLFNWHNPGLTQIVSIPLKFHNSLTFSFSPVDIYRSMCNNRIFSIL
jgi:hypothetical protein